MKGFNFLLLPIILFTLSACGGGGSAPSINSDDDLTPDNKGNIPPIARAGQDITRTESLQVSLSGTGSTDSDGTISSYLWKQISGVQVSLSDNDKAVATFTAPSTNTELSLEFELQVTDNLGASSTDKVLVTVVPNAPPMASAGEDIIQAETLQVTLSGTESTDTDGTISSYLWSQISGMQVSLSDSDKAVASFTAPSTDSELGLEFELQVTDNRGASSTDKVLVTIIPNSPPPEVTIAFPPSGSRFYGDYITVSGTASKQYGIEGISINIKVGNSNVSTKVNADGSWRAQNVLLPKNLSNIVINATATDRIGQTGEAETKIENIPTLTRARFSFNPQLPNMLYAIEETGISYDRIIAINLETMEHELLFHSDSAVGGRGQNMGQIFSVDFDSLNDQIVLADWAIGIHTFDIMERHLTTFELSGESLGQGSHPDGIAVDSENNRAIFLDRFNAELVSFNLNTGESTVISNNSGVGTGILFDQLSELVLETTKNRALVYDSGLASILAVDLSTGDRSVIASNTVGTGADLNYCLSLAFDSGKLIMLDWSSRIFEIDLENGDRNYIFTNGEQSKQASWSTQLMVDSVNNRYLINDFSHSVSVSNVSVKYV